MSNDRLKPITLAAEFGPDTRFEVSPLPPAPFRAWEERELEALKHKMLGEKLDEVWDNETNSRIRRAANEAAALAWVSRYPLLVFPTLFEEKAAIAAYEAERQARVRRVSRELLAV